MGEIRRRNGGLAERNLRGERGDENEDEEEGERRGRCAAGRKHCEAEDEVIAKRRDVVGSEEAHNLAMAAVNKAATGFSDAKLGMD